MHTSNLTRIELIFSLGNFHSVPALPIFPLHLKGPYYAFFNVIFK